jgi:hypothetical protein
VETVIYAVTQAVGVATYREIRGTTDHLVRTAPAGVNTATETATREAAFAAVYNATREVVSAVTGELVREAVDDATQAAVYATTREAIAAVAFESVTPETHEAAVTTIYHSVRNVALYRFVSAVGAAVDAVAREAADSAANDASYQGARQSVLGVAYDTAHTVTREATVTTANSAANQETRVVLDMATWGATDISVGGAAVIPTYQEVYAATYYATAHWVWKECHLAIDDALSAATREATAIAVREVTLEATIASVYAATTDAARQAARGALAGAVHGTTYRDVYFATNGEVYGSVGAATHSAAYIATGEACRNAVEATIQETFGTGDQEEIRGFTGVVTHEVADTLTEVAREATKAATSTAVEDATRVLVYRTIYGAIDTAIYDAFDGATYDAFGNADRGADHPSSPPDLSRWYVVPEDARRIAEQLGVGDLGLHCAVSAYNLWQGGNQWSSFDSFLSFFRHVAGLPLDYTAWDPWECLSLHSGPRIVHQEFCLISDRPEVLLVDDDHHPHCETGPFCRWRDGSALYAIHGVRVPAWLVETPAERLDPRQLLTIDNAEVRRCFVTKVGIERVCHALKALEVDQDGSYTLLMLDLGDGRQRPYLRMANPSVPEVWHVEGVHPDCRTVQDALNFRNGLRPDQVDDVTGADWFQQGDVCLFPRGATKFKSRPSILQ